MFSIYNVSDCILEINFSVFVELFFFMGLCNTKHMNKIESEHNKKNILCGY